MKLLSRALSMAGALAVVTPMMVSAQVIMDVKYVGTSLPFNTPNTTVNGGSYAGPLTEMASKSPLNGTFYAFCIDFDHGISPGQMLTGAHVLTFEQAVLGSDFTALKNALGAPTQGAGSPSASNYLQGLNAAANLVNQYGVTGKPGGAIAPQANWDEIQVAIWKLFSAQTIPTPSDPAAANTLLANAFGGTYTTGQYSDYRIILDNSYYTGTAGAQVLIARVSSVVPEPSTYALMGAGLLGLMVVSRRRKNTLLA